MKLRVECGLVVSLLTAAAVLTAPIKSAIAQDCTEQLAKDFSGDRAAVAWQVTGTQKGDMPGMPASNKAVNVAGVSLMECAGGKIKHNVDYWDMATTMRQLGFLPPPATN
jgi:steroid delta-isomerase-like uncharacterized protein